MGIDPDRALYLTPHEINQMGEGFGRRERIRMITTAQAFGADISERDAQRILRGGKKRGLSPEEQQRRLDKIKERFGET